MPEKPNILCISKNGIYVIELCVTKSCTKFQANIFTFGFEMAQKPSDGNDVNILKLRFFGISNCRMTKQMQIWNPETKLNKIGMF